MDSRYIYKYRYDAKSGEISITFSGAAVDYFKHKGWVLDIKEIRKMKNSAGQALALYLDQQPGSVFDADEMIARVSLGYSKRKENLRHLRLAAKSCVSAEFIKDYKMSGKNIVFDRSPVIKTEGISGANEGTEQ